MHDLIMRRSVFLATCLLLMSGVDSVSNMAKHERIASEISDASRVRRDAGSCPGEFADNALLKGETDVHVFANDSNPAVSLTWSGNKGVLLALTTDSPIFYFGSSKLYRSVDHGKSFTDVSPLINNARISRSRGVHVSPVKSNYVMLVAAEDYFSFTVTEYTDIYTTEDAGLTFKHFKCNFDMKRDSLTLSPKYELMVAALSSESSLWVSRNFGRDWTFVANYVLQVRWDPTDGKVLYYTRDPTRTLSTAGFEKDLHRLTISTNKTVRIADHVHSFGVQGGYIFISVEYLFHNGSRVMHVSKDRGTKWDAAQIPLIGKAQFYSLLDMSEEMVFVHVDRAGEEGDGVIYTSDERGIIYSQSLPHHLYPDQESVTDFYKVECLEGVYITSQLDPKAGTIHSVITFDKGGLWEKIKAPPGSQCAKTEKECNLQIHGLFSQSKGVSVPEFPKSSPSAPGIIIAHGNIGDALTFRTPDVYVSNDGGYSWMQPEELKGPHYYGIGDSGGILYAVQAFNLTSVVKFSLDQGQCWQEYKFIDREIMITGVSIEPGTKTTILGLWGWDQMGDDEWRSITVDFSAVLSKPCEDSDYEIWHAHETNDNAEDNCLLGSQVLFKRRKKGHVCVNGKDFKTEAVHSPCKCTTNDFLCDYGYVRTIKGTCLEDEAVKEGHNDICVNGTDDTIQTKGYRKIPGDKCEGGFDIGVTKLKSLHKSCIEYNPDYTVAPTSTSTKVSPTTSIKQPPTPITKNAPKPTSNTTKTIATDTNVNDTKSAYSNSALTSPSNVGIIVFLALTVVLLVCIIVFLIKRSMNFRTRYSRLVNEVPTHTLATSEMSGLDTQEDTVTANRIGSNSILYHDDSDEDLLIT